MVLVRSKDNQYNNPLASFATCLCRQRRRHEWTASSSQHDTKTANLALAKCEGYTGKKIFIVRIKSINRN